MSVLEKSEDEKVDNMDHLSQTTEEPPRVPEGAEGEEEAKKGKKNMGKMLKATIVELESTLKDSQDLLATRDKEIAKLKSEVEHYKEQTAKEVANKTRLAQSLDDSSQQAMELESALENWQLSMREYQQQVQQLDAALMQERSHSVELERRFSDLYSKKSKEAEQLTVQLIEARKKIHPKQKERRGSAESSLSAVDDSQLLFLKQAVYHLLIESRPEEHLRAIVSILNFSAEERKAVYAKMQEKKGYSRN